MPGWFGNVIGTAAGQAAGGAIAMGLQRLGVNYDNRKQQEQARALLGIQMAGEKEMIDYTNAKNIELYSPEAQKERLKEAGLNPALMYGESGAGGLTMASAPNPSASAESPKTAQAATTGMGIMNAAQIALINAQKRNIDADTANKLSENPNIPKQGQNIDADTTLKQQQQKTLLQGIENQKAQQLLTESQTKATTLANEITSASKYDQIGEFAAKVDKLTQETELLAKQNQISEGTIQDKINQIKAEAIGAAIDNMLKDKQITKTVEETNKIKQDIINSIKDLNIKHGSLTVEMRKAEIHRQLGERGLDIAQQAVIMSAIDKVMGVISNSTK